MKKFYSLDKPRLTNGQHFAFISAFVLEIQKIKDAPAKMKTAIDDMTAAQQEEDKYLKIAQGSPLTEKIRQADELRDSSYRRLRDIVKAWTGSGTEPQAKAAGELGKLIATYRINTSAQIDEETGLMSNMLTDISTAEMQANITAIGATEIVASMRRGNEQVIALLIERDEENANRVLGALRKARLNSDKAYAAVTVAVEAYNYTLGGYDEVITRWNATIDRYQEMLNRKTGSTKDNTPDGGGSGSDNPGSDNPGGSGSEGGGDNKPETPPTGGGDGGGEDFEE